MVQSSPINPRESTSAASHRLRTAAVSGTLLLVAMFLVLPGCQRTSEEETPAKPGAAKGIPVQPAEHPAVGKRLPALKLIALEDATKSVSLADLSGKVVLVNIWGPWCPPCRLELPHIATLEKKYRDSPDFRLLAITSARNPPENTDQLRRQSQAFLRDNGLDLPTYLDPDAVTRRAFNEVGQLQGFPTTFVMDRRGVIRDVRVGYSPSVPEEIGQTVRELLDEKAK